MNALNSLPLQSIVQNLAKLYILNNFGLEEDRIEEDREEEERVEEDRVEEDVETETCGSEVQLIKSPFPISDKETHINSKLKVPRYLKFLVLQNKKHFLFFI